MEDFIFNWLVGLFGDFAKAMAKRGGSALLDWLKDEEAERQKLLFAALPRAYVDLQNTLDAPQAGEFQRWLNERAAQKDKALGDALLNALFFEPNGVVALSADLQARVPTTLHSAMLAFLSHLHRHLWNHPEFEKHLQAKAAQDSLRAGVRAADALERISPPPNYASEEKEYLKQLVAHTELLEFIGIPEVRDRIEIKLEDVFIPLGAEEEATLDEMVDEINRAYVEGPRKEGIPFYKELDFDPKMLGRKLPKIMRRVTIDDALHAHMCLMIVGDPGAGKSTLLRYITLINARAMMGEGRGQAPLLQNPRLPILISLRRFAATANQSLVEFFYTYTKQTYQLELTRGFFEREMEEGRCIVCLDGLDEVFVSDQRVAVRDAVAAFTTRFPRNQLLITSRIVGYESAPLDKRAFAHHTILPFNENEIEIFVKKWYAVCERVVERANEQAEQLAKTIKGNDRLRKLAENPLMITIIALVHRIEAELPNERVKLYDKCTEALLMTREKVRGLIPTDRERPYYKNRRRWLEKLAFWMHSLSQKMERQVEVKRGDLKTKLIEFFLDDATLNLSRDTAEIEAESFIEMAKSRTGVLIERGDGIYSFVHLTFQEYFAACDLEKRYVTNLQRLWREIRPHLYDPRWREVILLLLGRLNAYDKPPSSIVRKILEEQNPFNDIFYQSTFMAARSIVEHANVDERLREEIVEELAKIALKGDNLSDYDSIGPSPSEMATLMLMEMINHTSYAKKALAKFSERKPHIFKRAESYSRSSSYTLSFIFERYSEIIEEVLVQFSPREGRVISLRFGLRGKSHTEKQTAIKFGVSIRTIQQIERNVLRKLKSQFRGR